ncbi:glutamine synthetase III family protein [Romboutsia sp. 1001713B170207_170306_H8]|uniref:glutamine synthetase III family protein n=1 Tax=Romboutsia sp. 1001713B170207_170306_H8 TaxID=2787112 RepID=UPI000822936B|nr:glutamine synthetase III [Romboutsia sp. 1001713B170207_170306_H8]SCG98367.1 Glutamine synthetase [uncultured Clostridium sp.]
MINIPDIFGSMVFNDKVMKERLPKDVYKKLKETIDDGSTLDINIANIVANSMKDWAIEKGATHFTHWFQPMTGITAEKHDSFISPTSDGSVIMEFSGKELIKGEPDASSFPSGGLRSTFEARGYTAWDPTSYAFIRDNTLCIPTVFCSYLGEVLDKKTPLLRSMEVINKQSLRILKLFGDTTTTRVTTTVGPEQEYFLIDKKLYDKREDLQFCGRTLLGARSPKGQELNDHYFGAIKPRVAAFMKELDEELWKLGVLSKTEHNEVAPAQHELAPIFANSNVASDHNQLVMDLMKTIAIKHGLVCLLHEKPFAGLNGSGKHNNWSLCTNTGKNLLSPGKNPRDNTQFLLFLVAVIKAVDEYQDLLRISVSSAGNDHRLGGHEAPPAIVSMFLGSDLEAVLQSIEDNVEYNQSLAAKMEIAVDVLPSFKKDSTDRNRTSPFAFTGNKFEFRMLGSTVSIACPNTILNTIVGNSLCEFADLLEKSDDFESDVNNLIRDTYLKHKNIIFNGNNYSDEWVEEANKRGLFNLKTTVDALPYYTLDKNIKLFEKHGIYTKEEIESRYEILLDEYSKTINIEALTLCDMIKKDVIPAVCEYIKELSDTALSKKSLSSDIDCSLEIDLVSKLSSLNSCLSKRLDTLDNLLINSKDYEGTLSTAKYYKDNIIPAMQEVRAVADELELIVSDKYWPYPTYGDLLFSI